MNESILFLICHISYSICKDHKPCDPGLLAKSEDDDKYSKPLEKNSIMTTFNINNIDSNPPILLSNKNSKKRRRNRIKVSKSIIRNNDSHTNFVSSQKSNSKN